jgi:GMP synthase-like glutamine amidotransferase
MQRESKSELSWGTTTHAVPMITLLQHGPDEPAGVIEEYLKKRQQPYEIIRLYDGDELPEDPPGHLIILGGHMSANDEREYPFLVPEKALIHTAVSHGSMVFGICLGAQLIAAALHEPVLLSHRERGWRQLRGCSPAWQRLFPPSCTVFQWHNETFNLPAGATLLAQGDDVANQAFRLGHAVGVQFHPEVTRPIISRWAEEMEDGERQQVLAASERECRQNRRRCCMMVDAFLAGWGRIWT